MKKIFLLSMFLVIVWSVRSQTAPTAPAATPAAPAAQTAPFAPVQPAAPTTAEGNPTTPGPLTPGRAPITTQRPFVGAPSNQFVPNPPLGTANGPGFNHGVAPSPAISDLQQRLGNLEITIEQVLPELFTLTSGGALSPTGNPANGIQSQEFVGRVGTNLFTMDVGTVRLLAALRADLQRTLPVLQALSASGLPNNAGTASNAPVNFVDRFTMISNRFPATPASPTQRQPLMPTGR